jgi:hypothetical protein
MSLEHSVAAWSDLRTNTWSPWMTSPTGSARAAEVSGHEEFAPFANTPSVPSTLADALLPPELVAATTTETAALSGCSGRATRSGSSGPWPTTEPSTLTVVEPVTAEESASTSSVEPPRNSGPAGVVARLRVGAGCPSSTMVIERTEGALWLPAPSMAMALTIAVRDSTPVSAGTMNECDHGSPASSTSSSSRASRTFAGLAGPPTSATTMSEVPSVTWAPRSGWRIDTKGFVVLGATTTARVVVPVLPRASTARAESVTSVAAATVGVVQR